MFTYTEALAKRLFRSILPVKARRWVSAHLPYGGDYTPPLGYVRFGDLRRIEPIDGNFGFGRGRPIDRYYIENFLERHSADVKGRVLEVGDDTYTRRFGKEKVTASDVLHVSEGNPRATLVGDLAIADHLPSDAFDCIILTQTLHLIYDVRAAIRTLHRILKPGGVLLATFPGISQIDRHDWKNCWYWSFTTFSAERLFSELFHPSDLQIETYGNVLAATAFLYGLADVELEQDELDALDPHYQVVITARAVK